MTFIIPKELNIIDINPEADEKKLVELFEEKTGKTLYPAQSERITISIINTISSCMKVKFNQAFRNLLLPYAKGLFLDFIGLFLNCVRLEATQAHSMLRINVYEGLSSDVTIPKGTEIETIDGKYIFTTDDDIVIKSGVLYSDVPITSVYAGELLNYKKGEINNLIQNYDYVESVTNTVDATGGSDEEDDDRYRERIYIAPEKFSTAGPRKAYKYFAMSAHKDIVDVEVERKQLPASITLEAVLAEENGGIIESDKFSASIDYFTGIMDITFKEPVTSCVIKIPPAATIDVYTLTKDGKASDTIIKAVENAINAEEVRPLTDDVKVGSAIKKDFSVDVIVYITRDADYTLVSTAVAKAMEDYFKEIALKLNTAVIESDIISLIKAIEGVYRVILNSPGYLPPYKNAYYKGTIANLEIRRIE